MKQQYLTTPFEKQRLEKEGKFIGGLLPIEDFFVPTVSDLNKLSDFLDDCKTIVDIGSGYGLLIISLAKMDYTGKKKFLGIDTIYWKQNKFPIPKNLPNLKFEFNGVEAMASKRNKKIRKFNCVICSWMPQGSDWRENLAELSIKKIILILSKNFNTGITETYSGLEKFGFRLVVGGAWTSSDSLIQLWCRESKEGEQ